MKNANKPFPLKTATGMQETGAGDQDTGLHLMEFNSFVVPVSVPGFCQNGQADVS